MIAHLSGIELARSFYNEVVRGVINEIPHAAALLGEGSEVLGYDTSRSTDHAWGPRLQLFVEAENVELVKERMDRGLPEKFKGYPVQFYSWQTDSIRHHVEVTPLDEWLQKNLRFKDASELTPSKWLSIPQQHLLQFTKGAVFRDDLNTLTMMRKLLSQYPKDIWLWMMACAWDYIGSTQHFHGRTAEAGDKRGSRLIANHLVRLMMELSFLQEKVFWPYPKWFGSAFSELQIAAELGPIIDSILDSSEHQSREEKINQGFTLLAERHNALELGPRVSPKINDFEVGINDAVRPYPVINAGDFVKTCLNEIEDEKVRQLARIGSIDQLTHANDVLINFTNNPEKLESLYKTGSSPAEKN